jgi:hypothetical protein
MLVLGVFITSCGTIPHLNIDYRLPEKTHSLEGSRVFLSFVDQRPVRDIIGEGAREDFRNFAGNITLSLARANEQGFRMGVYEVPSLFEAVFKKRLEALGIEVLKQKQGTEAELSIVLNAFLLDLTDGKWTATMDYEARLNNPDGNIAKQMVSGKAERQKLVGRKQADKMMGGFFTDMINRLDVPRLFKQAGLAPGT